MFNVKCVNVNMYAADKKKTIYSIPYANVAKEWALQTSMKFEKWVLVNVANFQQSMYNKMADNTE